MSRDSLCTENVTPNDGTQIPKDSGLMFSLMWIIVLNLYFCVSVGGYVDVSSLPPEASRGHQAAAGCELGLPGLGAGN